MESLASLAALLNVDFGPEEIEDADSSDEEERKLIVICRNDTRCSRLRFVFVRMVAMCKIGLFAVAICFLRHSLLCQMALFLRIVRHIL